MICPSCKHDAGVYGRDPRAKHACSYDKSDGKLRSINWMEFKEAFFITHADGVKLASSDQIIVLPGREKQFNSFLLRCPAKPPPIFEANRF